MIGPRPSARLVLHLALAAALFAAGGAARAAESPAPRHAASSATQAAGPVDVNQASEADLLAVPGIGKSIAHRIVEFRDKNGPFERVDDLLKVQGIGEKSLQKLRPHVTVSKAR